SLPSISPEDEVGSVARAYSITSSSRASSAGGTSRPSILAVSALARAFAAPPKNKRSGRAALPGPLAFPFPPSRLLAPTELCARCLGPLMRHLDNSGFIRDRKVSKKSERWFGDRRGRDGPQCETFPAAIRYPGRFLALAADPTRLCANASRGKRDLLRRGRRHHCAWLSGHCREAPARAADAPCVAPADLVRLDLPLERTARH